MNTDLQRNVSVRFTVHFVLQDNLLPLKKLVFFFSPHLLHSLFLFFSQQNGNAPATLETEAKAGLIKPSAFVHLSYLLISVGNKITA